MKYLSDEKKRDKSIYLTFDMDWVIDEVLEDFYNLIIETGVTGLLNVTHDTKWLKRFRDDKILELGIHPNYNFLLNNVGG
ncbi:MAG: hypothetical protein IJT96_09140 [Lachnospiraceae bacterium]|nr:hypothetical protein [Lachnospiraceae bacterium]